MADECDLARKAETEARNDAIARARQTSPVKILARCVDCGETIPKERRDACRAAGLACIRCYFCQDLFAKKGNRHA